MHFSGFIVYRFHEVKMIHEFQGSFVTSLANWLVVGLGKRRLSPFLLTQATVPPFRHRRLPPPAIEVVCAEADWRDSTWPGYDPHSPQEP